MSQTKAELVNGLSVNTALDDAITVNSSGQVGIGDDSPDREFIVKKASSNASIKIEASNAHTSQLFFSDTDTENVARISVFHGTGSDQNSLLFGTAGSSRLAIDSSGDIGVGTITPDGRFHIMGGNLGGAGSVTANTSGDLLVLESNTSQGMSFLNANDERASIFFGTTGTDGNQEASISYAHEAVSTTNDRRAMIFKTGGNVERMRINTSGNLLIATTSTVSNGTGAKLQIVPANNNTAIACKHTGTNDGNIIELQHQRAGTNSGTFSGTAMSFRQQDGTQVGTIVINNTSTSFNTSSDYRLKENISAISDGITRLKTLKPYRFNFKGDSKIVDGFFAHEVTTVPEAITGTKDEVDSNGNPKYQAIDQSKLVPLLTAALQEAVTKIETLETKVAALEAA